MSHVSTAFRAPYPRHSGRGSELREVPATDQAIRVSAASGRPGT